MPEDRLNKFESKLEALEKVFYKIDASLENIEGNIKTALTVKDMVITHEEKHKVTEARLTNLEKKDVEIDKKITELTLKIAIASGVWMGVFFFIKELFFK